MNVNSRDINADRISEYYVLTLVIAATGLAAWVAFVTCTAAATDRLAARDDTLRQSAATPNQSPQSDQQPLLQSTDDAAPLDCVSKLQEYECWEEYSATVFKLTVSLLVTIASSVMMGALFVYVHSDAVKISTALVFSRLLADAASRLAANVWRPAFAKTAHSLLVTSCVRLVVLSFFFVYASGVLGESDWLIIAFVATVTFVGGMVVMFSYTVAQEACLALPKECQEVALAHSTLHLNMSFNAAGFIGALLSVIFAFLHS